MTLLERVSMLIRSNLNDLIDKAEDPEKMVKQIILDAEAELRELKGQVAVSVADQHMLEQKCKEHQDKMADWMHKAELSLDRQEEALARTALERYVSFQVLAGETEKQVIEQKSDVEGLKSLLFRLEQKLEEARSKGELLAARSRRSQALDKASGARLAAEDLMQSETLQHLEQRVEFATALSRARAKMAEDDPEEKLNKMERDEQVDSLLAELKRKRAGE
ncbi:MAG: PspA/IM30 family protein [Syntrophobacteraceae bacterium]